MGASQDLIERRFPIVTRGVGQFPGATKAACRERDALVLPGGRYDKLIRLPSPLAISDADLTRARDVIASPILEVSNQPEVTV